MSKLIQKIKTLAGISFVDSLYKALTFRDVFIAASPKCLMRTVKRNGRKRDRIAARLKEKDTVTVAFFLQSPSVWKYDRLYWALEANPKYTPVVVLCPFNVHLNYDKSEMVHVLGESEKFAIANNYRYFKTLNNGKWRNVRKELNPGVIFYTKPYKDTLPAYHIYRFKDKLNCYAPYGICCVNIFRINFNLPFNNLLWKYFVETDYQKGYAEQYSTCKGTNAEVVGSLGMETMMLPDFQPKDVWKHIPDGIQRKRIIWAPHHTVDYLFNFSNFFSYCELMLQLAEKYQDRIQIAFKPHPVLKFKLINIWGKEKTEAYYQRWKDLYNGQLEEGYYIDLFLTSDALIHDCASFTAEYFYARRPVMFLVREGNHGEHWNSFGEKCFDLHYHGYNEQDIEDFIQEVLIKGNDTKAAERDAFYYEYLYPKDGIMPSQKIVNILNQKIFAE